MLGTNCVKTKLMGKILFHSCLNVKTASVDTNSWFWYQLCLFKNIWTDINGVGSNELKNKYMPSEISENAFSDCITGKIPFPTNEIGMDFVHYLRIVRIHIHKTEFLSLASK